MSSSSAAVSTAAVEPFVVRYVVIFTIIISVKIQFNLFIYYVVTGWGWGLGGGPDVPHAANSQHQQVGSTPPEGHSSHGGVGNNHSNNKQQQQQQQLSVNTLQDNQQIVISNLKKGI